MASESRHLSTLIDRPMREVYDFASDPTNLPAWAPGLGSSVELVDGQWVAEAPMGRVAFAFVPYNPYGILDHEVTLPSGETVDNPMRVVAHGDGCEVVFTLRRQPGMTDEDFARDADAVSADLAALKRVLEDRPSRGATAPGRPVGTSRTVTQSIESEVEPRSVVGLLVDPRRIPEWAPGFADVVDGDEQRGWRVSKDGRQFSLRVDVSWEAGTVDYLREIAPGREGGAYLRAAPRPGGGSVIVMTLPLTPGSDPDTAFSTLHDELNALVKLLTLERR